MAKSSFTVAEITAAPAERVSHVLELSLADAQTKMPLFVLNGAHEGPTVVITAGIHGAEYVGIEAAMLLATGADPKLLHGQLVIAPIASMTAFKKRAIYLAPPDDKNLNRCFPGKADGSFAEQLAYWLFENLIKHADVYLDLHGGDMNEALVPFSIVKRTGKAELDRRAIELAEAFGLPNIVASEVKGSTVGAAADAGILAVLAEVGGQGLWPEQDVQTMLTGLHRALAHVGVLKLSLGDAPPARILESFEWLRSQHDGLFYPECKVGDVVTMGQILGVVRGYLGNVVQFAKAPCDGTVLFLVTTLAMNAGDPLLAVGA
jgi:predicted deacylase